MAECRKCSRRNVCEEHEKDAHEVIECNNYVEDEDEDPKVEKIVEAMENSVELFSEIGNFGGESGFGGFGEGESGGGGAGESW